MLFAFSFTKKIIPDLGKKSQFLLISITSLSFAYGQATASAASIHISTAITTSYNPSEIGTKTISSSTSSTANQHPILHAIEKFFHINNPQPKTLNHITTKTATASNASISPVQSGFTSNPLIKLVHNVWNWLHPTLPTLSPSPSVLTHAADKIPVIFVHGTTGNADNMIPLYTLLEKAGIPAYATTIGTDSNSLLGKLSPTIGGLASLESTEKQLADYIAKVQAETGAKQVDLVGHSQGGLLIKDYIAHDTENNVKAVVDLAADNHGSTATILGPFFDDISQPFRNIWLKGIRLLFGPSFPEQLPTSPFMKALDKTPDTKAGIHYLVLGTRDDFISTPYQNTFLKPVPGASVTNQEVHSIPGVIGIVDHGDMVTNPAILNRVVQYIEQYGEPQTTTPAPQSTIIKNSTQIAPPAVSILD